MCQAMTGPGPFDPDTCPMLKGLPREEQRLRMATDPRIAACIAAINGVPPRVAKTTGACQDAASGELLPCEVYTLS